MRIALLLIMLSGAALTIEAQSFRPAIWSTFTDGLDTGVLKTQRQRFENLADFRHGYIYEGRQDPSRFLPCPYTDLEWVVVAKDTLLRRLPAAYGGELVQLWEQGTLRLYRSISPAELTRFYWLDQGQHWSVLSPDSLGILAQSVSPSLCREALRRYQPKEWGDSYLRQLTQAINRCRSGEVKTLPRFSNWVGAVRNVGYIFYDITEKDYALQHAEMEVKYGLEYRGYWNEMTPAVGLVLQAHYLRYRDGYDALDYPIVSARQKTDIEMDQLYVDVGLSFEPLIYRRLSPLVEIGSSWSIPTRFRHLIISPGGNPDVPSRQEMKGGMKTNLGFYYALGARLRLADHWLLSCRWRWIRLMQAWPFEDSYFESYWLRREAELLPQRRDMMQLALYYSWN